MSKLSALNKKKSIQEIEKDIRRIVVDADWLLKVKELIKYVMEKKEDEIVLRREIFQQCEFVVEALIEYLPFYIKFLIPDIDNGKLRKLQEELNEKNSILAQVDTKINSIYMKLKVKK